MLTNFVSQARIKLLGFMFLFMLFSPVEIKAFAPTEFLEQDTEIVETVESAESVEFAGTAETAAEKKNGKEVEINQDFFISLGLDLFTILLIIVFVYYPNYKKLDTIFTFILFNVIIFLLTYVLNTVKISMGAAFGLFAVFSMLRYRTSSIDMKDMTYLFIFIALGLMSAIQMDLYEMIIICSLVFGFTIIFDTKLILKREFSKIVRYEKIEMITPEKRTELIDELKTRTGLNIHRISINEVDFLRDVAIINVYYYD